MFKDWLKKNIKLNEATIREIPIGRILPDKTNMEIAVDSLSRRNYSHNIEPIKLYKSGKKFVVGDGHHRLLEAIISGKHSIEAKIHNEEISNSGTVKLDHKLPYYGLDKSLDNGYLLGRLWSISFAISSFGE